MGCLLLENALARMCVYGDKEAVQSYLYGRLFNTPVSSHGAGSGIAQQTFIRHAERRTADKYLDVQENSLEK